MRPRRLRSDDRAMSGKWQAFVATMVFFLGTVLTLTFWPIATRERIGDVGDIVIVLTDWLLQGVSGYILIYGFVIFGALTILGGAYMAIEQLYYWIQDRRDGTVNEYQVK